MNGKKNIVYPYIPNSVPEVRQAMLEVLGFKSEDIYKEIRKGFGSRENGHPEPILSGSQAGKTCNEHIAQE